MKTVWIGFHISTIDNVDRESIEKVFASYEGAWNWYVQETVMGRNVIIEDYEVSL